VVFALYLLTVRPDYIKVLWEDPAGVALLVLAGILLGIGILWLRKAIRVEV
jgi:tight adherence protein B